MLHILKGSNGFSLVDIAARARLAERHALDELPEEDAEREGNAQDQATIATTVTTAVMTVPATFKALSTSSIAALTSQLQ